MNVETTLMKMLLHPDVCVYNPYFCKYKLWRCEHACKWELACTSPVFTPGYSASYIEHCVYYMYIECVV